MVAIIRPIERTTVAAPSRPQPVQAAQTSAGSFAEGLTDVGGMFAEMQDEVDTAAAKDADARFSEVIRQGLYGDQTGFMYSEGSGSLERRGSISEQIEAAYQSTLEGLSPMARAKAQSALQARRARAFQTIDQHAAAQGKVYLNTAAQARVSSSIENAIFDPDAAASELRLAAQEIDDMAARQGWAPEVAAEKKREAQTAVHAGIIGRLEVVDPVRALEYLHSNKGRMNGSVVAKLEAALGPKVKEHRGRQLGAAAARGDEIEVAEVVEAGAGFTTLRLADGQVVRREGTRAWRNNNPGNIEFGDFARSRGAVGSDGRFAIFPSYRAGREAKAALIFESTAYRNLSVKDAIYRYAPPSENDSGSYAAQVAAAAGVPVGAEMGDLTMAQREAVLDAMERVEGFRPGEEEGGSSRAPTGLEALLEIEDPDERDAAVREYNLAMGARKQRQEAEKAAASQAAFELIEAGGNVDDLTVQQRQGLGREEMAGLRAYQDRIADGRRPQTVDSVYIALMDQMANDPEAFMASSPATWRADLDDGDFDFFLKRRADMIAGKRKAAADVTVSAIRTASKSALAAAGLDDDAEAATAFETRMLRWSTDFKAKEGRAPTPLEMHERVNMELVPVVLDPRGLGNKQSGRAFELDYDGEPLDPGDDLRPEDLMGGALKINGAKVSDEILRIFAQGFNDRFGRAPTVQEAVEGLIESGVFE